LVDADIIAEQEALGDRKTDKAKAADPEKFLHYYFTCHSVVKGPLKHSWMIRVVIQSSPKSNRFFFDSHTSPTSTKNSSEPVDNFLSYPGNRQTNTKAKHNLFGQGLTSCGLGFDPRKYTGGVRV